jgi:hypothetical protein
MMTFLTPNEVKFVETYGEPQIDLGGSIPYGEGQHVVLPNKLKGMRNGIPFEQSFDGKTDADAQAKRDGWVTEMITRLTTAKTTLMANSQPTTPSVSTTTV